MQKRSVLLLIRVFLLLAIFIFPNMLTVGRARLYFRMEPLFLGANEKLAPEVGYPMGFHHIHPEKSFTTKSWVFYVTLDIFSQATFFLLCIAESI